MNSRALILGQAVLAVGFFLPIVALGAEIVSQEVPAVAASNATVPAPRASSSAPSISLVANAEDGNSIIAPNTWMAIYGTNLAGDTRTWQNSDFVNGNMPTKLDGVSVTVNGKAAYVYYIGQTQIDFLAPPDALSGTVTVLLNNNGASATATVQTAALSPAFFVFSDGAHVAAIHADGSLLGPSFRPVPVRSGGSDRGYLE